MYYIENYLICYYEILLMVVKNFFLKKLCQNKIDMFGVYVCVMIYLGDQIVIFFIIDLF